MLYFCHKFSHIIGVKLGIRLSRGGYECLLYPISALLKVTHTGEDTRLNKISMDIGKTHGGIKLYNRLIYPFK